MFPCLFLVLFDLAIEADLHPNMIGLIERGKNMPAIYTLLKKSNALGVSLDEWVDGVESYYQVNPFIMGNLVQIFIY